MKNREFPTVFVHKKFSQFSQSNPINNITNGPQKSGHIC